MRKRWKTVAALLSLGVVCVLSVTAASLHAAPAQADQPENTVAQGRDLSVAVDGLTERDLEGKTIMRTVSIACGLRLYDSELQALYQNADAVVYARIDALTYPAIYGNACTKSDLTILDCLKGGLEKDDRISMIQMGGYIPLRLESGYLDHPERFAMTQEEVDQTVIFQTIGYEPLPEIGQIGVFFLMAKNDYNNIPDGTYCRVAEFESVYIENESGILERYAPVGNYYFLIHQTDPQAQPNDPNLLQNGERPYTYEQMKELLLAQTTQ